MGPKTYFSRCADCSPLVAVYGVCLLLAAGGYVRFGHGDLSEGADLAAEAASAGVLLIGTVFAAGGLRRRIAERNRTAASRLLSSLMLAVCFVIATPLLARSYAVLSQGLEAQLETAAADATTGAPKTALAVGPGGHDIRLSGEILDGAAARLDALLAANPTVERIHLTSEGGLTDEGQAIGDIIAAHHLVTYVPDFCVSACTLAFVRGTERLMMRGARLGFHAPYETGLFGETFQADGDDQKSAYLAAGVAPDFVDAALKVASSDIWIPDASRLIEAHVATSEVDPYRFPDSNLDGMATPDGARALVLRNFPLLEGFQHAAPTVIDRLADWYLDAYRAGQSEGVVHDDLQRQAARAIAQAMVTADDATLVALARNALPALDAARQSDEAGCVAIATQGDLISAAQFLSPDDPRQVEDVALLSTALAHRPEKARHDRARGPHVLRAVEQSAKRLEPERPHTKRPDTKRLDLRLRPSLLRHGAQETGRRRRGPVAIDDDRHGSVRASCADAIGRARRSVKRLVRVDPPLP